MFQEISCWFLADWTQVFVPALRDLEGSLTGKSPERVSVLWGDAWQKLDQARVTLRQIGSCLAR